MYSAARVCFVETVAEHGAACGIALLLLRPRKDAAAQSAGTPWVESAGIAEGPVFRSLDKLQRVQQKGYSDKAVALILNR